MLNPKTLDELAAAIGRALPQPLTDDLKRNLHAALRSAFDRLDLVTREELEVQEQVLARTRAKLQELERKLAELEQALAQRRPE